MTPYWFQELAIKALFDYFSSGKKGNPLIGLPTGTGKSVVIALFIKMALMMWPETRVVMLTHVKELIQQNAKRMLQAWPHAPLGLHSAGLNVREFAQPIIFGGIQSLYKIIGVLGHRDLLIVDEAHLIGPEAEAMYGRAIETLLKINPYLKVIGLSATLYRMAMGHLTTGSIFTDVCFDMTDLEGFNRLIAEGFIAPVYPFKTDTEFDLSHVKLLKGEFNKKELEATVDRQDLTYKICQEMLIKGDDREHWLTFASGVNHAEHISEMLNKTFGVKSVAIHSKIDDKERRYRLDMFEAGEARCAVNNNVLTVGYDFAPIDLISHMRGTMSTGLWVQMNGRGTRISPETNKRDCRALDFARNTKRLGPINDPILPNPKAKGNGDAPVRVCPACGCYNHASARFCFACNHEFTFHEKLTTAPSTDDIIRSDTAVVETFNIDRVWYGRHIGKGSGKPCMKVTYVCGLRAFYEWVHFDADGVAGHKAREWWRQRMAIEPPKPENHGNFQSATDAALSCSQYFRTPARARVWVNKPYPEVQSVEY